MWEIISAFIALLLLLGVVIFATKADRRFRDKSLSVRKGMSEFEVVDAMEKDPLSIETLPNGAYAYIYERRQWKGWGMMVERIEIVFDKDKRVASINRSKSLEKKDGAE